MSFGECNSIEMVNSPLFFHQTSMFEKSPLCVSPGFFQSLTLSLNSSSTQKCHGMFGDTFHNEMSFGECNFIEMVNSPLFFHQTSMCEKSPLCVSPGFFQSLTLSLNSCSTQKCQGIFGDTHCIEMSFGEYLKNN